MSEDVNTSLIRWQTAFLDIMKKCIPRVTLRTRKNLPWLTKQLIQLTKKKKLLFQKAKRSGFRNDFEKYKWLRNKLTYKLRESKRNYI